ncbi:RNA 2'-phosphotransferase [Mesorhizobium sp. ASY16-5R]|uniref:RNA 2'-phosphotransferase n=1 Tax=Mesorhizobium sp. ASY16-5R TaxID=3445772 RepID=UPI003FA0B6A1
MPNDTQISKFMSLVLRHAPQEAGLVLDENGWTDFTRLCEVIRERFGVSADEVLRIVDECPKKRFTIDENRIRAAQGHSVEVDLELRPSAPPDILFHGTKERFLAAILKEGLTRQARHHVHLSSDIATATKVAERRKGDDVVLKIDAKAMAAGGFLFFLSENGVWLTNAVPPEFLSKIDQEAEA